MLVVALLLSSGTINEISIPKETPQHQGKLRLAGSYYYVSTQGNDSNPGSETAPFLTLQKAANVAQAGDTVLVEDGEYQLSSTLVLRNSGSSGYPITFKAEHPPGVVIDGPPKTSVVGSGKGIRVDGNWVVLDGLVVRNSGGDNIGLVGDYDEVLNCESYGAAYGTQYGAQGVLSDGNNEQIVDSSLHDNGQHGIYIDSGNGTQVIGNQMYNNTGWDFQVNCQSATQMYNLLVSGNVIHNLHTNPCSASNPTPGMACGGMNLLCMQDSQVVGNSVYETYRGILLGASTPLYYSSNNLLAFNTVVVASGGAFIISSALATGNSLYNNILVENGRGYPITLSAAKTTYPAYMDYNVIWNTNSPTKLVGVGGSLVTSVPWSNWTAQGFDVNSKAADPLFKSLANHDYHLIAGSPAIDAATSQCGTTTCTTSTDLDGNSRPQGTGYDIGAYEYQSGYNPTTTTTTTTSTTSSTTTTLADSIPPTVSLVSPLAGATLSGIITISATASDNVGVVGVQFKLDGSDLGAEVTSLPYSVSWNSSTAGDGTHTITVVARDAAGNTASASVTIKVDTVPPSISITNPSNNEVITGLSPLTAAASDALGIAGVQFKVDGQDFGTQITLAPYSTSFNTTQVANGLHTIYATATDFAGNTAADSVNVTVNNTVPASSNPPTISSISSSTTPQTATITWVTDVPADSQVEYGTNANYGSLSALDPLLITSHSITLTALTAGTTYHYKVMSKNANGLQASSTDNYFTTLNTPTQTTTTLPLAQTTTTQLNPENNTTTTKLSQTFQTTTLPAYAWSSTTTTLPTRRNLVGIDRITSLIDDLWNWILSFLKLIKQKL